MGQHPPKDRERFFPYTPYQKTGSHQTLDLQTSQSQTLGLRVPRSVCCLTIWAVAFIQQIKWTETHLKSTGDCFKEGALTGCWLEVSHSQGPPSTGLPGSWLPSQDEYSISEQDDKASKVTHWHVSSLSESIV